MQKVIAAFIPMFFLWGCLLDVPSTQCGLIKLDMLKQPELDSILVQIVDGDSVVHAEVVCDSSHAVYANVPKHQKKRYEVRIKGYCRNGEVDFVPYTFDYKFGNNPHMLFYVKNNENVQIDAVLQPLNETCGKIESFYIYVFDRYHTTCEE